MRFVKILRLLIGIVLLAAMAVLLLDYVYAFVNPYTSLIVSSLSIIEILVFIGGLAGILLINLSITNKDKQLLFQKIVLYVLFAAYCMLLIAVLFGSGLGRRYVPQDMRRPENSGLMIRLRNSNFIPLRTVYDYICGAINNTISKQIILNNLMGNLILFAPMGVFLPAVYKSSRLKHILIMVIVLILIETVQLITGLGIFDIDDILLNFAGFFIVYWIWRSKIVEIIKKKLCIWI